MPTRFQERTLNLIRDIAAGANYEFTANYRKIKQQSTDRVFPDEPKLTKVVSVRSVGKRMIDTFFNNTTYLATVALEDHCKVSSKWYTAICLWGHIDELRKNNTKRCIILHMTLSILTRPNRQIIFERKNGL